MYHKIAIIIAYLFILSSCSNSNYRSKQYDPFQNGYYYQYTPPEYNLPKQHINTNIQKQNNFRPQNNQHYYNRYPYYNSYNKR
ncbi:MAG: hypothetical protein HON42_00575 [Alphaproteobacteria bacterium]|nr:hypothetical protein [Alphaproteobacteria bacterium]MBT5828221.1 hypothetical protein [Alphaproteobacteria bacterium]